MLSPRKQYWLNTSFLLLGLILFGYLLYQINIEVLLKNLKELGGNFFWILLISGSWYFFLTISWKLFIQSSKITVPFWKLFRVKLYGEAINTLTPLGWGGGDPARVLQLRDNLPMTFGTASVVVDRTLSNLAVVLFMLLGFVLMLIKFSMPLGLKIGGIVMLLFMIGFSVYFYYRSHEGLIAFALDCLVKLRLKRRFSEKTLSKIHEIDRDISDFYKNNQKGFWWGFFIHFCCRLLGVVEIYLAAYFLGNPISFMHSYLLGSMTVVVNLVFFFVPGTIGVLEGAYTGIFVLLHLDPAVGASVQIVRRLRMVFWTLLGLVLR